MAKSRRRRLFWVLWLKCSKDVAPKSQNLLQRIQHLAIRSSQGTGRRLLRPDILCVVVWEAALAGRLTHTERQNIGREGFDPRTDFARLAGDLQRDVMKLRGGARIVVADALDASD